MDGYDTDVMIGTGVFIAIILRNHCVTTLSRSHNEVYSFVFLLRSASSFAFHDGGDLFEG